MLLVQCDFDDTISLGNVSTFIREAFSSGEWRQIEEEYHAGKCSVEESNIRQFALVKTTLEVIENFVLSNVEVRQGFPEFVDYCHGTGIRLVVVSSGLDMYINPTLRRIGLDNLERHSGSAYVGESGISVEYRDPMGKVITRGFKDSFLRHFMQKGNTVVYIGDGLSDIAPACEADFAIARSTLQQHLTARSKPFDMFETFFDVLAHVDRIRRMMDYEHAKRLN